VKSAERICDALAPGARIHAGVELLRFAPSTLARDPIH